MKPINSTPLPEPIAQYIDSANRLDAADATECFTPDAIVRDEQKEHVGHAAIERWIAHTIHAYQPHVTVTSARTLGGTVHEWRRHGCRTTLRGALRAGCADA